METKPNFPSQWNRGTPTAKPPRKAPSKLRGLVAFLILVALAGGAAWYLFISFDHSKVEITPVDADALIKDVAKPTTPTNAVPKKPVDPYEDYDHETCYRDENGILRRKGGRCRVHDPARVYHEFKGFNTSTNKIFTRMSDRCISRLLTMRPGSSGIPDRRDYYSKEFQQDFMESITEPIVIKETDSPSVRRMKEALKAARLEIMDRIRAGENLGDILTETRKEIKRLGEYRQNLTSLVREKLADSEISQADAETIIDAANAMFEKEGIRPLRKDSLMKWHLRLNGGEETEHKEE